MINLNIDIPSKINTDTIIYKGVPKPQGASSTETDNLISFILEGGDKTVKMVVIGNGEIRIVTSNGNSGNFSGSVCYPVA